MIPGSGALARLYGAAWELRRDAYARGWLRPERIHGARVVSIGNLTTGGTGKTTLTLHLAGQALRRGLSPGVVCRRYRPGRDGRGDEELLFVAALGEERVWAVRRKLEGARRAARDCNLVLVDDGFSHWRLERDLDLVVLDAQDPWGGERLLPAGRMREPRRALARAQVVVVSRLGPGEKPDCHYDVVRPYVPAAALAAGRHRVSGLRWLAGREVPPRRVWVASGTGNPASVRRSAEEAGLEVVGFTAFRDHHAFRPGEARDLRRRAQGQGAALLVTRKDAVRWPAGQEAGVAVLEVQWEWVDGGEAAERQVFGEEGE
jgi:tetraacyldisaccharide 4'-kinase